MTFGCPSGHPEGQRRSSLRLVLAPPYCVLGYDLMIAVGLLRFGLDLPEQRVAAVLEDGWGLPIAQSTVSRLSTEFLVRWRMLGEERLPPWVASLSPWVVQIDGTVVVGSPVTFRVREARTGATLWAEQTEVESKSEVVGSYGRSAPGSVSRPCSFGTSAPRSGRPPPRSTRRCRRGRTTGTSSRRSVS